MLSGDSFQRVAGLACGQLSQNCSRVSVYALNFTSTKICVKLWKLHFWGLYHLAKKIKGILCVHREIVWYHFQYGLWGGGVQRPSPYPQCYSSGKSPWFRWFWRCQNLNIPACVPDHYIIFICREKKTSVYTVLSCGSSSKLSVYVKMWIGDYVASNERAVQEISRLDKVAYTTGLKFFLDYNQGWGSNIFSMDPDLLEKIESEFITLCIRGPIFFLSYLRSFSQK